jgi:Na+-driven multidrug efflux pump
LQQFSEKNCRLASYFSNGLDFWQPLGYNRGVVLEKGRFLMKIQLSDHFTYGKLIRFTIPSIAMMIFTSIYGVVDGLFVSNFVGKTSFAAVNLIMPLLIILGAVGFMLGTGGNAVVSKALGEGDSKRAREIFSMLIYTTIVIGIALALIGILIARPVAELFASGEKDMTAEELKAFLADSFKLLGML